VHTPDNRHAISARGQALTADGARLSHLGETVERYAAFRPDPARVIIARAGELPQPAVYGEALFGLDAEQRNAAGYVMLDRRRRIGWVQAQRISDGAVRWVPAATVYLSREWQLDEARFCASVSHGLAAHRSANEATTHAAFEMYERACMTRAWHCQDFGLRLDPAGLNSQAAALAKRVAGAGLKLLLMALSTPPDVPAVMALIWGEHAPWFMVGASAKHDLQSAATSALLEASCGWQTLMLYPEPALRRWQLRQTENARGHHRFYASAERAATVVNTFLRGTRSGGRYWPTELNETTNNELFQRLGSEAVVVDLTPPDCAACGFSVQRVLAPGLPIYSFGRIGTPRIFQQAAKLPDAVMPHPFR